jgi:hypothetical protein
MTSTMASANRMTAAGSINFSTFATVSGWIGSPTLAEDWCSRWEGNNGLLRVALQHLELGYRLSDPAEHIGNLASDVDALFGLLPSSVRRTLLPHR